MRAGTETLLWRPMATAPMDGTYVLLFNDAVALRPYGYWIGAWRAGRDFEPFAATKQWRDYRGRFGDPTHWMPLPAPPVGPEDAAHHEKDKRVVFRPNPATST